MSEPPPGYIVAEISVRDGETYDDYVARSGPVLERYGAELLVHAFVDSGEVLVREGGRSFERLVVVRFESLQRVSEFYESDDYQAIVGLRHASAVSHVYHAAGVAPTA
jgi:uncharacterized protein (DUF1330 family)